MWQRASKRALDLYSGTTRRRGARLGLLVALVAVVPGLVAGTAYISGVTSQTGAMPSTPITAVSCGFYEPINDTSGYTAFTSGTNGTTLTATFSIVKSATYEYLVDEVAVGCTGFQPNVYTGLHVFTASATNVSGSTPYYSIFVSGGNGAIGEWTGSTPVCIASQTAPCNNYPDNQHINPTTKTSCAAHASPSSYGVLYPPFHDSAVTANTWEFNDSAQGHLISVAPTAPHWDATCGSAAHSPTQQNITMSSPVSTDVYFFYVITVAANLIGTTPAGSVTLQVDSCNGGSTPCATT